MRAFWPLSGALSLMLFSIWGFALTSPQEQTMSTADQAFKDGNYKVAAQQYEAILAGKPEDFLIVQRALRNTQECYQHLGDYQKVEPLLEQVAANYAQNWQVLQEVAELYQSIPHYGFIVEGEFQRGNRRHSTGGKRATKERADYVRCLQLYQQAMSQLAGATPSQKGEFLLKFSERMMSYRESRNQSWELQKLTDLNALPEVEEVAYYWGYQPSGTSGAPVDQDGNPVLYSVPASWEAAQNDGERWRWLLSHAAEVEPALQVETLFHRAQFLQQQFGVQTLNSGFLGFHSPEDEETKKGPFQVSSLTDQETIAQLASGVKRFTLPAEQHYIALLQQAVERGTDPQKFRAHEELAAIYENRMQYPQAADQWRAALALPKSEQHEYAQDRLDQIIKPWGTFESLGVLPAGKEPEVPFRFRNGKALQLTAHALKYELLVQDAKAYLKQMPKELDWEKMQINDLGRRIVERDEKKYLGEQVATWKETLEPRDKYLDRRTNIKVPIEQAGAYLLTATFADGNTSRIVVWIDDTVIVKKMLDGKQWYFLADARTGQPVPGAKLQFFGYENRNRNRENNFRFSEFAEVTDENGQVMVSKNLLDPNLEWLVTATAPNRRMACFGFERSWFQDRDRGASAQTKVYAMTDRPVYRPGQVVKFKVWVREVDYLSAGKDRHAGKSFPFQIVSPRDEKLLETNFTADEYGGFDGEVKLSDDATLGVYSLQVPWQNGVGGGISFQVEEYKKPEYEVLVEAPDKPVALGEKLTATVRAKYYFGAPVTSAQVKVKVERTTHDAHWYPRDHWDWLYGNGYWWFARDYDWYPGWNRWGCLCPIPPWWHAPHDPPELILENEYAIGPDGTVKIEIDTALAKALHGDHDHKYSITAEVVDESRRTIVGSGSVLAARDPFQVFAWSNRGYYQVGDMASIGIQAQTLDQKPIVGPAVLKLYAITYSPQGKPSEELLETWETRLDEQGSLEHQFKTVRPGQFRLSCEVTDADGHQQEGAVIFLVRGQDSDLASFRFDDLELIPDQKTYHPGETVKLMINTNREQSTVALFLRPINGVYLPPQILTLQAKSTVVDIKVLPEDLPNFFIEAITLTDAQLFEQVRDIAVPPEKRVFEMEILPSSEKYLPGQEAEIRLLLKDLDGKPVQGSVVLTAYDRSVEYISGGSNVPEIQSFFWNWKQNHSPQSSSTLSRYFWNLLKDGETPMGMIGVFGNLVADVEAAGGEGFGGGGVAGNYPNYAGVSSRSGLMVMDCAPIPTAAAAMSLKSEMAKDAAGEPAESGGAQPMIRSQFADTAIWIAHISPDQNGVAEVKFPMPENLTDWKLKAWGMSEGTRVAEAETTVATFKDVLVRLQAPRFFVEKDEVILSANVHNYLPDAQQAKVLIQFQDDSLALIDEAQRELLIPAGGEVRVDWKVRALHEGTATVTVQAMTPGGSDAMQMTFPVYVHGMLKTESMTGVMRPQDQSTQVDYTIPAERRPEQSRLEFRYSPTLAGAMVDALPYLLEYPYGCTEQTLNRFLPAVITQQALLNMQLDLNAIREKRTNLNAQEIGNPANRAAQWKRFKEEPVFDQDKMQDIVKTGVRRLTDMQLSDGGWGWFSGSGEYSSPHTTATVVHGLQIAQQNGVALVDGMLERGVEWLKQYQTKQIELLKKGEQEKPEHPYRTKADNLDALVYMVLVDAGHSDEQMQDYLYRDRLGLSIYSLAMFGLSLHHLQAAERLELVLQNIEQYYVEDLENETGYLKLPAGYSWWFWHGNEIEANAYYLKLLTRVDPEGVRASQLVKYLLNNRKHATYWNSTRDTALCVEAFAEFLDKSGENNPDLNLEILVDGQLHKELKITRENLFDFDGSIVLEGEKISTGKHTISVRKSGKGSLYWNLYVTNFTLEDPIAAAGLELKVRRHLFKLIPRENAQADVAGSSGQVVSQQIQKYDRLPITADTPVASGDLLEIELAIDSKNDYEYVLLEDFKAAGTEPVELRSGYLSSSNGAYAEFRDEKVAFFFRALPRGSSSLTYRVRAEIPGTYSALPTHGYAMYAPELQSNSDEHKLQIQEMELQK